jgi:hypothetical protein
MISPKQAIESMGIDFGVADAANSKLNSKSFDDRVCICGHAMRRHSDATMEKGFCIPGRTACHCQRSNMTPVLKAENVQVFRHSSNGPGTQHALVRGMVSLAKTGKEMEWIEEPFCMLNDCGSKDEVTPVVLETLSDGSAKIIRHIKSRRVDPNYLPSYQDVFACKSCRGE